MRIPPSDGYKIRLRERWGRALALAWAIIFLIIGLAVALTAKHQTGELVGSGLGLLGILPLLLSLYLFRSGRQSTENDGETIAEKFRI